MTKSTLKTLWFSLGGLLATWLAIVPEPVKPADPGATAASSAAVARELTAGEFGAREAELRRRLATVAPAGPSSRNPFRFGAPPSAAARPRRGESLVPPVLEAPPLSLAGIAERHTAAGLQRTAVISGDGQLYLAAEGDRIADRYTVVAVESDGVMLRDAQGAETRLRLQ